MIELSCRSHRCILESTYTWGMSFGGKAGPPPLATREDAAAVRPKVRTTVAKDACDDSVGAFIMNVSKKIHDEWQNPSLAWKKIVPMLVFTYERYDQGHAPQHIIEHICRSLNNLVRGNSSNTKELRECLADNGGIEVLVDVLRRSTNGGIPTRTRYCAAQGLQHLSTEGKWVDRIGGKGTAGMLLNILKSVQVGHTLRGEVVGILMNMASVKKCAAEIVEEGGIEAAELVLACRPGEASACIAHMCGMVANLATFRGLKQKVCSSSMVHLLKLCRSHEELLVLSNAVVAIKNIVHDDSRTAKKCCELGGVAALQVAEKKISAHVDTPLLFDNPAKWLPYLINHVRASHTSARRALLICNEYPDEKHPWRSLVTASDNAWALQTALESAGIECTIVVNTSRKALVQSTDRFVEQLSKNDMVLVYYFGMGCQISGKSYLLPVNIPAYTRTRDALGHLFSLDNFLSKIEDQVGPRAAKIFLMEASKYKFAHLTGKQMLGEQAISSINANAVGKNWFIMASSADPVPATDAEAGGQYSVFTHSLICGVLEKKLDLLGFGKYVSRKYAVCMKDEGKVQAPFVTCSMAGDFYFHKRFSRSGAPVTEKTIEDDEFEFRLQRYSGMNVINIDNFSTNAPSNKRIVIRPPAPSGANYVEANKHISPNLARRIPTGPKPVVIASKRDGLPLSKDGPQNRPLHIQEAYRETRTAPGGGEFIRSSNLHLHQSGTNNMTHWLGELRR